MEGSVAFIWLRVFPPGPGKRKFCEPRRVEGRKERKTRETTVREDGGRKEYEYEGCEYTG